VQFGFDLKRKRAVTKPEAGHWKRTNVDPRRYVRELRVPATDVAGYAIGSEVKCDVFKLGDFVDVIGTSKGAGFAGGMKRHHFSGAVASHGAKEVKRHGGALGGHTFPGMRMPGHKGAKQATVRNLEVMRVDTKENLLYLKGAVPGPPNGYLTITTAKTRKPRPPQVVKPKAEKKPEKQLAKGQEKKGGGGGKK
jgi:large subunit ribosomal protein L3